MNGWILTLIQVFLHAVLSLEISIKSQIVARLTKGMMLEHRPSPRIAKVLCAVLGCLCSQHLVLKSCPARWILVPVSRRSNHTASWTKALWCHLTCFQASLPATLWFLVSGPCLSNFIIVLALLQNLGSAGEHSSQLINKLVLTMKGRLGYTFFQIAVYAFTQMVTLEGIIL